MSEFLLSAQAGTQGWNLAMQYITYGVIIVISIVLLIVLRKHTRLPRHPELKKQLTALREKISALDPSAKRIDFIREASRAVYRADNLVYVATLLGEKERYADLGRISTLMGEAREELAAYKYGKKEPEEREGIDIALAKVDEAIAVIDKVIERDNKIKNEK